MSEEKNAGLVNQAAWALMEDIKEAFFVLDREGEICFLNRKAEKLTGKPRQNLIGTRFEDVVNITAQEEIKTICDLIESEKKSAKAVIKTPGGGIPVEICLKPVRADKELMGTVLIVNVEQQTSEIWRFLETLGSAIQRQPSAQKIYETLEELTKADVTLLILFSEKDWFTVGYHTCDKRKMHMTEFIMGIPVSEIRLSISEDAFNKMVEQKYLFFHDISSIVSCATSKFTTTEIQKFFSLMSIVQGVAVPLTSGDGVTGVLILSSEVLKPEDAPVVSALGVQVSAALERAYHYEQLVSDLKVLEEKISSRTRELEKVKSQMESIVHSSVDAIMAADMNGYITFVNKGVEAMFGYRKADILGQSVASLYTGGKKEAKRIRNILMKKGQIENAELDFLGKEGQIIHTLASLSLLKDRKGTLTGIMAVLKDVTEQKRLQQTLESLNKAASRIQKARTREEIFRVTAEELNQFDFYVIFILFNEDKTAGKVEYTTAGKALEILKDEGGADYEFSLDNQLFRKLIRKKEAVFIDDVEATMKLLVPSSMYEESERVLDFLGITDKKSIVVPLITHDETTGLLAVISDVITLRDTPSIVAFANQVSTALENARLLEESQNRADELAKNLEEQLLLRELNTRLFLAQYEEEVLDAAIEGIHKLGKSFSFIALLNEVRTYAAIVRLEMEQKLLKLVEKTGRIFLPEFSILSHQIPLMEKNNIFYQFFTDQIPLVSSSIDVHSPVLRAEMDQIYCQLAGRSSSVQRIMERASRFLPYKSIMVFPITVGGRSIGSLAVASQRVFSEKDFVLMQTAAEMISSAMERIKHSEKLNETFNELRAVQKITGLLNMGASLQQILAQISSSIREVYHYRFAFPLLLDPSRRYFTLEHVVISASIEKKIRDLLGSDSDIDLKGVQYPFLEDSYVLNQVLKEKKCVILKGFKELAESISLDRVSYVISNIGPDLSRSMGLASDETNLMIAPLPYGEEVIGILVLGHQKVLTVKDFEQLEYFLDQVGIAISKSEVENRLRQSLKELKELDQMKSEFIDIASHELRTPLTTLKLYLEMMAMEQYGKLSEPLRERIRVMEEGVNRLEEIINQTLVASRLIKNKLVLEKKSVSLLDVAAEVVRQLHPLWKTKNQNIFLESPPHLSEVEGDEKALFTMLSNLVDNAIRYSAENTEIFIRFAEHQDGIECTVCDQGCGISPDHIEKVFDEFYIIPSEKEYARMDGRTGLGLFIAKGIVERHGGKIWVESVVGKGSTFHVVIPR